MWSGSRRVGLAVSGGPDSLALLVLAHAALPAGRLAVATVDHGLRPESTDEAAHVAAICAERGIAHATLSLALAPGSAVQVRARDARYRALGDWCGANGLGALVTAHHADDQAETLVMRLNRGAGLRGLAGMRAIAKVPGVELPLVRPLLEWRHDTLVAVVVDAGLAAVEDPSNRDVRFERARVRAHLADAPWLDRQRLAISAAHLAQADDALAWAAAAVPVITDGDTLTFDSGLPRALALRVLERVIAAIGSSVPRGQDLAQWHDRLAAGEVATLAGVRGDGRAKTWRFSAVAPHHGL